MKKDVDLEKLATASDAELFKAFGLTPEEAKSFDKGARHLFGEPDAPEESTPPKAPDIREAKPPSFGQGDIRPKP